jgi:hypothetical protein
MRNVDKAETDASGKHKNQNIFSRNISAWRYERQISGKRNRVNSIYAALSTSVNTRYQGSVVQGIQTLIHGGA